MVACEKCWVEANRNAMVGGSVVEWYRKLLVKNESDHTEGADHG